LAIAMLALSPGDADAQPDVPIKLWNFDSTAEGWRPLHQIELAKGDGYLKIRSTGRDPHMVAQVEGPAGWKVFIVRARHATQLNAQLFYTTEDEPNTSESNSIRFTMKPSKKKRWSEVRVYFRTSSALTSIRLDPHTAPMEMQIDRIEVRNSAPPADDPATDPAGIQVPAGFRVELVYSVPKSAQGSWVSLTSDHRGRLIVSDQYGGLFRVTPNPLGQSGLKRIESIDVPIGEAQGLLYAFDSLYVMVNRGKQYESGLYRVRDTNNDDQYDSVELLKALPGRGGEHGPHSIVLSPDGRSLYVVAGNKTTLPENITRYHAPKLWQEDQLLPRAPCSNGHNTGVLAPGGWICRLDPEGNNWELIAAGFRNPFDMAFNHDGELFTFDADMEMDVGSPWYRPTRVCHVVPGGEFGWRFGTGKWPVHALDSLPPVVDIGLGSPTGVTFGYGARFPPKYQRAFYVCDWTYGRMFAVHLAPHGGSYKGQVEPFLTGTPLPLTDVIIHPLDGAMYFTIGGRKTQSGLYRVVWDGDKTVDHQTVSSADRRSPTAAARRVRQDLEASFFRQDAGDWDSWMESLNSPDRFIRYAARIAIEHQPPARIIEQAFGSRGQPDRLIGLTLAGVRSTDKAPADLLVRHMVEQIRTIKLTTRQWTDAVRTLSVAFARHGRPTDSLADRIRPSLEAKYPAKSPSLNRELTKMLVYLKSPVVVQRGVPKMAAAVTQETLLGYAMALRTAEAGWTLDSRRTYFQTLNHAETKAAVGDYVGGGHLQIYIQRMRQDARESLGQSELKRLADILDAVLPSSVPTGSPTPRPFVKRWTSEHLAPKLGQVTSGRSFVNGKAMFQVASCIQCHRFQNRGGIFGPDITGVAKRYSRLVLLREIIEPSVQVSDQFQTHAVLTHDGEIYRGRILDRNDRSLTIATDPRNPMSVVQLTLDEVEEVILSKTSMMPKGLLDTLTEADIFDLLAYLESGGQATSPHFAKDKE
jgi:putative heme-binding domain-containing protein